MKKMELINLGETLNKRGVRNTKKVLNNFLFFLAENEIKIKNIQENSKHLNIKYSTKAGKKVYTLHIDNTLLKSNKLLVSIN